MFLSRNKKNNVYPCKPQFYYIKVGFEGGQNYIVMFFVMSKYLDGEANSVDHDQTPQNVSFDLGLQFAIQQLLDTIGGTPDLFRFVKYRRE